MARTHYNDTYDYEIFDNGYDIYYASSVISQRDEYSHPYLPDGTFEENCLAQLEELTKMPDPSTDAEKLRADLDYMSLMLDVPLPSEEEEGE